MKKGLFRLLQGVCLLVMIAGVVIETLLAILIEDRARMEDRVRRL